MLYSVLLVLGFAAQNVAAFGVSIPVRASASSRSSKSIMSMSSTPSKKPSNTNSNQKMVVISPPGGVGQVTAVKAATMGAAVKWFVVGMDDATTTTTTTATQEKNYKTVSLSPQALQDIEAAGGSVELAGTDAAALLQGPDAPSAVAAVRQWCRDAAAAADSATITSLVCCMDGVELASKGKIDQEDPKTIWMDGIKVAAKEAGRAIQGIKLAVLPADQLDDNDGTASALSGDNQGSAAGVMDGLLKSVVGRDKIDVPSSLTSAMAADGGTSVIKLRHGDLFGIPESSPDFSALVGGPRKDAVLCEEYTMRSVRMDPSLSVSGNTGVGTRSSRHAVGEAAALIATKELPLSTNSLDVCVSSQIGVDPVDKETWQAEIKRVEDMLKSGQGAQLFSTSFSSVPNIERLADWLATKWAPAVMRTYDIAAIRIGARPVYASRTAATAGKGNDDEDTAQVEIVWQQLDDFQPVTAGKMLIQVSNDGIVATRAAGDASKGYGSISRLPLPGEAVLVRRLAEAASQAIDKGLANRPISVKKTKPEKKKVQEPVVVTSVQSSGTVEPAAATATAATATVPATTAPPATSSRSSTGPRTAGARRSSERERGSRKRARKQQGRTQKAATQSKDDKDQSDKSSSWQ